MARIHKSPTGRRLHENSTPVANIANTYASRLQSFKQKDLVCYQVFLCHVFITHCIRKYQRVLDC